MPYGKACPECDEDLTLVFKLGVQYYKCDYCGYESKKKKSLGIRNRKMFEDYCNKYKLPIIKAIPICEVDEICSECPNMVEDGDE